jgi:hypothetical protein
VTPTKQTKKYFRPGWNEDFNNSRQNNAWGLDGKKTSTIADKAMLQAWIEKNLNNSRQSNASGLDGTKTSTNGRQSNTSGYMERRLQQ